MTASFLHSQGNEFFRNGEFKKAYDTYKMAVTRCNSKNYMDFAVLYSNLAATALKLDLNDEAFEYSTRSISINPDNIKSYIRRGEANLKLCNFEAAYKDYAAAARIEPNNMHIRNKAVGIFNVCVRRRLLNCYEESEDKEEEIRFNEEKIKELMIKMNNKEIPDKKTVLQILKQGAKIHNKLKNIETIRTKKINIIGDTHGQYKDVLTIFNKYGFPSDDNQYLFNGDFVDRGENGVEIVISLLAWKIFNPSCIFLNRGNHESENMNRTYGFEKECCSKYSANVFQAFSRFFETLPLGHIINDKIFVVHGGLFSDESITIEKLQKYPRILQPPECGPLHDILWSDPMEEKGFSSSKRGVVLMFGTDVTERFLRNNNLDLLVRSHQEQMEGYSITQNEKCITVFSAPNYKGEGNKGAILTLEFAEDYCLSSKEFHQFF